ncbi:MAG: phosphoglucosamine mutase [Candidatus Margulisiibacteriota bacterium]|nr:phosphoglucosamine mutase [Candidatus Margulisiibacteriota bacterium]
MSLKISISGIRGYVPEDLTPEICADFAKAFGTFLGGSKLVIVGTDPRASSKTIKESVFAGLLSTGCKVIDLGICPTPTVGIMVRKLKADGGMIITASHNPLPWNGLKFIRGNGIFLNEKQLEKLINIYENKAFAKSGPGTITPDPSAIETHLKKILKIVDVPAIRRKKYKVALDCCNGAGSEICIKLLEGLGCQLKAINCDVKRPFPHPPEPIAENLTELSSLIKKERADIGFALDSDADRLAIISSDGTPIGEETTLVLVVKSILAKQNSKSPVKNIVITNLSTTKAIDDIAKEYNGTLIRTKIGEVHIAEEMEKLDGLIGGEGNGGVIYPPIGLNRDGQTALALVLDYMAASGKSLAELINDLPAYHMVKEKIKCKNQDEVEKMLNKVKLIFKGEELIVTDGVKVLLPQSWIHVRASNTEPVIRLIAEGKKKQEAKDLIDQVLDS